MRIVLCGLVLALALPAAAQVTAKPVTPPAATAMKAGPPPGVAPSPQKKALLYQLSGLQKQQQVIQATIAQTDKQIAALQAKKAAGKASDADLRALQAALDKRTTLEKALSDIMKKIADTQAALANLK
jgi:hypothetical protein